MTWPQTRKSPAATGLNRNSAFQPPQYNSIAAPVDKVLARLDRVKPAGKSRWRAQCPVHDGHSLQVTEADDGKVLFKCWGCDAPAAEICRVIGLEFRDLFPPNPTWRHGPGRPRSPRMSAEMREQLALDHWIVHVFLADSAARRRITEADVQLAAAAIARLHKYDPAFFERAQYVYGGAKA